MPSWRDTNGSDTKVTPPFTTNDRKSRTHYAPINTNVEKPTYQLFCHTRKRPSIYHSYFDGIFVSGVTISWRPHSLTVKHIPDLVFHCCIIYKSFVSVIYLVCLGRPPSETMGGYLLLRRPTRTNEWHSIFLSQGIYVVYENVRLTGSSYLVVCVFGRRGGLYPRLVKVRGGRASCVSCVEDTSSGRTRSPLIRNIFTVSICTRIGTSLKLMSNVHRKKKSFNRDYKLSTKTRLLNRSFLGHLQNPWS